MDNIIYGTYYYTLKNNTSVILLSLCNNITVTFNIINSKFTFIKRYYNNTFLYEDDNHNKYILWINKYDINLEHNSKHLSCQQPINSVDIYEYIH